MTDDPSVLARLAGIIQDRKKNPPPRSYTTSLMQGGVEKIGAKVLEEAAEVVDAAHQLASQADDTETGHLVAEAADLVYHLLVMLGYFDLTLAPVEIELDRRFGVSGLDEKEARD
ncbi:MAG: phosphoribosyl-ATP diphosphatase [Pirellulaceae bacterium]|nr:phosphoribosyl-ATP diphosphatase [Pirellulaceae bacterium]